MIRLWREIAVIVVLGCLGAACTSTGAKPVSSASETARAKPAVATSESKAPRRPKEDEGNKAELPRPRRHHYVFAHRALPRVFFSDTDPLFMSLRADPEGTVTQFWSSVGESLPVEDRLPADGLTAEYRERPDGIRLVIVTLPRAQVSPEAIFAVLAIRGRDRWYLTYERSENIFDPDSEFAILCGWGPEGNHLNFGVTGDYSRKAFEEALERYFAKLPAPVGGFKPGA